MAIAYNWVISQMDTAPSDDGLTNVVKTVHWRYQASEGAFFAEVYGSIGLSAPDAANFKPYASLTEADVVAWLEENLNVNDIKNNLNGQIENLKNPPIVNLPFPWVSST